MVSYHNSLTYEKHHLYGSVPVIVRYLSTSLKYKQYLKNTMMEMFLHFLQT